MKKSEMIARIHRLEQIIVALHERADVRGIITQIEAELYQKGYNYFGGIPEPLEERIEEIERLGLDNDQ